MYGKPLRGLFAADDRYFVQLGADFASLEARVMGHFVIPYKDGEALAESLVAVKPNDLHAFPVTNQLLTPEGWKTLDTITYTDKVLQWCAETKTFSYVTPTNILVRRNNFEDIMYSFYTENDAFSMTMTSKHRVLLFNKYTETTFTILAENLSKNLHEYCDYYIYSTNEDSLLNETAVQKIFVSDLLCAKYESTELVGCVSVPSTYILVKENDSIFVSGNCLDEETQILTKQGWQYFRDISIETNVAQWDSTNNNITFSYPIEYIKQEYKGDMISVEGDRLSILMTPEHRNVVYDKNKQKFVDVLAKDLTTESGIIPTSGLLYGNDIYHEHIIQAVLDKFTDHSVKVKTNNGYTNVIKKKSGFVLQSSDRQFLEQIQTDLCKYQVQSMLYEKKIKRAAYSKEEVVYQVFLPFKSPNLKGSDLKHTVISKKDYDGFVYCVTVDTSYIICKRNNHIFITGNSVNARKLGITRDEAKGFSYATLYRSSSCKTCKNVGLLAA